MSQNEELTTKAKTALKIVEHYDTLKAYLRKAATTCMLLQTEFKEANQVQQERETIANITERLLASLNDINWIEQPENEGDGN